MTETPKTPEAEKNEASAEERPPLFDRDFLRQTTGFLTFSLIHPWFFVADRFTLMNFYLVCAGVSFAASLILKTGVLKKILRWALEFLLFIGIIPLSGFGVGLLWLTKTWWLLALIPLWFIIFRATPLRKTGFRPGWLSSYYVLWCIIISVWYGVYALPHDGFQPEEAFTAHYPPSEFTKGHADRSPAFPYDVAYAPKNDLLVAALKEKGGGLPLTFPADFSNGVVAVRTQSGERFTLPLPKSEIPETIAIHPSGKRMFVNLWKVAAAECTVIEVSLETLPPTIVGEVSLGENLQDIIFDSKNDRVLAFGGDRNVFRLSYDPLTLEEVIPYERDNSFYQVGNAHLLHNEEGLTAYISTFEGVFAEWDAEQGGTIRKVEQGRVLPRMAYDPKKEHFYVTDILHATVSVIDRKNMELLKQFQLPGNPAAIAVMPPKGLLFVADYLDGSIRVLNQDTGEVVASGYVGPQVRALTYEPESQRLFGVSKAGVFEIDADILVEKGSVAKP